MPCRNCSPRGDTDGCRGIGSFATVWRQVAGDEIAAQTRVGGIKSGVLHVTVTSSALLGELVSFLKPDILKKLKHEHAELRVRDIKFRLESRVSPSIDS